MGALGVGAVKDSVIGSKTERVVRRVRTSDMLIVKHTQPMDGGKIVVAVDGSPYSFGGLMTAPGSREGPEQAGGGDLRLRPLLSLRRLPQHFRRAQ